MRITVARDNRREPLPSRRSRVRLLERPIDDSKQLSEIKFTTTLDNQFLETEARASTNL
jgi:hypothetical protein